MCILADASHECPYLLTTPSGRRAGAIVSRGMVLDPQTRRTTQFNFAVVNANNDVLVEFSRSGEVRQSDATIFAPGTDTVIARISMIRGGGKRVYHYYSGPDIPGPSATPLVSLETNSLKEEYAFFDGHGRIIAGGEFMQKHYSCVARTDTQLDAKEDRQTPETLCRVF